MKLLEKSDQEIIDIANPYGTTLLNHLILKIMAVLQEIFHHKCYLVQMK